MSPQKSEVRSAVPLRVLWMWTGLSAVLHTACIGGLCYASHLDAQKREAAAKAKSGEVSPQTAPAADAATEASPANAPAAGTPAASTPAAATPAQPRPAPEPSPSGTPASGPSAAPTAPTATTAPPPAAPGKPAPPAPTAPPAPPAPAPEKPAPPSAEKILGIDKVAKPEDDAKGGNPFSNKGDDLLKDLK